MEIGDLSAYTQYLSSQIKGTENNSLKNIQNKDFSEATDEELMDACKQFEAYFLEQVFKGMEKTVVKADNSYSASTTTLVDYYKDEMYKKLASTSTEQNSIGLAQKMYEQMKRTEWNQKKDL